MSCLSFDCPCGDGWANNGLRWQACPTCGRIVKGDYDEEPDNDDDSVEESDGE